MCVFVSLSLSRLFLYLMCMGQVSAKDTASVWHLIQSSRMMRDIVATSSEQGDLTRLEAGTIHDAMQRICMTCHETGGCCCVEGIDRRNLYTVFGNMVIIYYLLLVCSSNSKHIG